MIVVLINIILFTFSYPHYLIHVFVFPLSYCFLRLSYGIFIQLINFVLFTLSDVFYLINLIFFFYLMGFTVFILCFYHIIISYHSRVYNAIIKPKHVTNLILFTYLICFILLTLSYPCYLIHVILFPSLITFYVYYLIHFILFHVS